MEDVLDTPWCCRGEEIKVRDFLDLDCRRLTKCRSRFSRTHHEWISILMVPSIMMCCFYLPYVRYRLWISITRQDVVSKSLNRSNHHSFEGVVTTRVRVLDHHGVPFFGERNEWISPSLFVIHHWKRWLQDCLFAFIVYKMTIITDGCDKGNVASPLPSSKLRTEE
jgi:hypothetical protein